ncbi:S-adenosyl-L-methionine-dependent methyltransferase [Rhizodiscina lignyota]|uniref:S-adenosyl-L-methionine-dependent methyltransferase n=1 Tax=Rhizodiscina lignyota TaxID=1504668 RepID=A0A9P4M7U2_9PEZI|nr:S-adenosyl-L-methionine-dependent methyltransferase [Rhizodiscina lignyota]
MPPIYGSDYERMCCGCTSVLASQMVSRTASTNPITSSSYILDSACGPGIVTQEIKRLYPDARILASDLSPAMLADVERKRGQLGWKDVETKVLDVRSLEGINDETFSHVFVNLGIQIPNDPEGPVKMTREVFRVLKTGGVAILSNWADRVWPAAYEETRKEIRPSDTSKSPMAAFKNPPSGSWFMKQLEEGGFNNNVELLPVTTYTSAKDMDELVENMMLAKGMFFPDYSNNELEKAKRVLRDEFAKLRTFEKTQEGVRIGMKAWIGVAWKKGDEGETVW